MGATNGQPPKRKLAIGALAPELKKIEQAQASGKLDAATQLAAIRRRIESAERRLWRAERPA